MEKGSKKGNNIVQTTAKIYVRNAEGSSRRHVEKYIEFRINN